MLILNPLKITVNGGFALFSWRKNLERIENYTKVSYILKLTAYAHLYSERLEISQYLITLIKVASVPICINMVPVIFWQ